MAAASGGGRDGSDDGVRVLEMYEHKVTSAETRAREARTARTAKIMIIGNVAVGKTSLMARYCDNVFSSKCQIGVF